jgi:hypothetical protein
MVEPSTAEVVLAKPLSHKQIQRRLATIPYRVFIFHYFFTKIIFTK